MARSTKKRKFSNNQIVVFRFGDRKIVGKVVMIRPVGKKFAYDVYAEDGKIYSELGADTALNMSIDTYLTKLFYKKYNIDENTIPDLTEDILPSLAGSVTELVTEDVPEPRVEDNEKEFFLDDDHDPNY
jgi:hypothetical protein